MFDFFSSSGIVGEIGESKDEYYIWTHKKLDISYNNDQIVDVSLTSESKAKLVPNSKLSFTYEVHFFFVIDRHLTCKCWILFYSHTLDFEPSFSNIVERKCWNNLATLLGHVG